MRHRIHSFRNLRRIASLGTGSFLGEGSHPVQQVASTVWLGLVPPARHTQFIMTPFLRVLL